MEPRNPFASSRKCVSDLFLKCIKKRMHLCFCCTKRERERKKKNKRKRKIHERKSFFFFFCMLHYHSILQDKIKSNKKKLFYALDTKQTSEKKNQK